MQILSDYDYRILFKLKCKLHVILVLLLHEVHSPAINRNLYMLLEVYTNMIKSNFAVLNSVICVHTIHVC